MSWLVSESIALGLYPDLVEEVTPQEYINLYRENPDNIKFVRIIPGRLGDKKFARILIVRKTPHISSLNFTSHYGST